MLYRSYGFSLDLPGDLPRLESLDSVTSDPRQSFES